MRVLVRDFHVANIIIGKRDFDLAIRFLYWLQINTRQPGKVSGGGHYLTYI